MITKADLLAALKPKMDWRAFGDLPKKVKREELLVLAAERRVLTALEEHQALSRFLKGEGLDVPEGASCYDLVLLAIEDGLDLGSVTY